MVSIKELEEKIRCRDRHARLPASIIGMDLTLRQFKVYAALSFYKGGNGQCWPSIMTISRMTKIDERNTTRVISELEGMGLLKRDIRSGGTTMYTLYEPELISGLDSGSVSDEDLFILGEAITNVNREKSNKIPLATVATTPPAKLATPTPGHGSHPEQYSKNNTIEHNTNSLSENSAVAVIEEKTEFGNKLVNKILAEIEKVHGSVDGAKGQSRQFAHHIGLKLQKMGATEETAPELFGRILKAVETSGDTFVKGLTTSPKSIYQNWGRIGVAIKSQKKTVTKFETF